MNVSDNLAVIRIYRNRFATIWDKRPFAQRWLKYEESAVALVFYLGVRYSNKYVRLHGKSFNARVTFDIRHIADRADD